jgi:hypothetical protein
MHLLEVRGKCVPLICTATLFNEIQVDPANAMNRSKGTQYHKADQVISKYMDQSLSKRRKKDGMGLQFNLESNAWNPMIHNLFFFSNALARWQVHFHIHFLLDLGLFGGKPSFAQ